MHMLRLIRSLCIAPILLSPATAGAAETDLAGLAPRDTLVYVEANGLHGLLAEGLDHPAVVSLMRSDLGQRVLEDMDASPEQLLAVGELMLGFPLLPTLAELTDRGISLSVVPRGGRASYALVVRTSDADLLEDTVLELVELAARKGRPAKRWRRAEAAETIDGAQVWRLNNSHLALADDLLVLARDRALLKEVLALRSEPARTSLGDHAHFEKARAAAPAGTLGWVYWDIDGSELIARDDLHGLRELPRLPQIQMLLGPGIASIGSAEQLTIALDLDDHGLRARTLAHGVEPGAARVLLPDADSPAHIPPALRRHDSDVTTALLHRDFAELIGARVELFDAQHLPKFSEALSNLALFFGGAEIETKILPHLSPWMRVVSREVDFADELEPGVPLPAVALLIDVDEVESIGFDLEAGFQTMIGLINVDRAQKGQPPLRMRLERVGEIEITRAHFLPPRHGQSGLDLRYNLEPACTLVGRTFVLGTHADLVSEIGQELASRSGDGRSTPPRERVELAPRGIADLLAANREALVMNAILKEGKPRDKAEEELDFFIGVSEWLRALRFELAYERTGKTVQLDAELIWKREG